MANPNPRRENLTNAGKGAPSQGRSRIQLSLSPDVIDRLGEAAKSIGCTRPEAADLLLRSAMGLPIDSKNQSKINGVKMLDKIDRESVAPKVDEKIQNLNLLLNDLNRIQRRIDDYAWDCPSMSMLVGMTKQEAIASQSLVIALDEYGPFVAIVGAVGKRVKINAVVNINHVGEDGHMIYLIPGCKGPISTHCQFIVAIEPCDDRESAS